VTGPEHYREAERLLVSTDRSVTDQFGDGAECARQQLAAAQVHATLALAAATVNGSHPDGMRTVERQQWDLAVSS
jgi:hypothetical protein